MIPDKFNVAGHEVVVEWVSAPVAAWGSFDPDTDRICLHECLRNEHVAHLLGTVVHELAHAVSHYTGAHYYLFHGDDEQEEAFARLVELQVFPAIMDLATGAKKKSPRR